RRAGGTASAIIPSLVPRTEVNEKSDQQKRRCGHNPNTAADGPHQRARRGAGGCPVAIRRASRPPHFIRGGCLASTRRRVYGRGAATCALLPQAGELGKELAHSLVSLLPVLAHGLAHYGFELRWGMWSAGGQRRRLCIEHCGNCIDRRIAFERGFPGYHFIKNNTEAEYISAAIEVEAARLLGRHVSCRSHDDARLGINLMAGSDVRRGFGGAKIGEFGQT